MTATAVASTAALTLVLTGTLMAPLSGVVIPMILAVCVVAGFATALGKVPAFKALGLHRLVSGPPRTSQRHPDELVV